MPPGKSDPANWTGPIAERLNSLSISFPESKRLGANAAFSRPKMHRPRRLRNILAVPESLRNEGTRRTGGLPALAVAHCIDLLVGREAASLLFGKGKPPVDG